MSLIDKLKQQGSVLSAANGGSISVNPLATQQSKLHADGTNPGYSLDGANASTVNSQYQAYKDGAVNALPQPSQLDLNGKQPSKYTDNLPK